MSDDNNIFQSQNTNTDKNTEDVANLQNDSSNNDLNDLLSSIKNDRGEPKYKDTKTALEALRHSQEYIATIKQTQETTAKELADLKAEVERLRNIENSVTQLTQENRGQQNTPVVGIDESTVANLIDRTLSKREIAAMQKNNIDSVVNVMQSTYGNEAGKIFYEKAAEFGMTKEGINELASKSPTAVLKLFGLENKEVVHSTNFNKSSVNSSSIQPKTESYLGKNTKPSMVGATTQDFMEERENSKKLVDELHSKGMTVADLTDPKLFFKHFK